MGPFPPGLPDTGLPERAVSLCKVGAGADVQAKLMVIFVVAAGHGPIQAFLTSADFLPQ